MAVDSCPRQAVYRHSLSHLAEDSGHPQTAFHGRQPLREGGGGIRRLEGNGGPHAERRRRRRRRLDVAAFEFFGVGAEVARPAATALARANDAPSPARAFASFRVARAVVACKRTRLRIDEREVSRAGRGARLVLAGGVAAARPNRAADSGAPAAVTEGNMST